MSRSVGSNLFFDEPILNCPHERSSRRSRRGAQAQRTQKLVEARCPLALFAPIPRTQEKQGRPVRGELYLRAWKRGQQAAASMTEPPRRPMHLGHTEQRYRELASRWNMAR